MLLVLRAENDSAHLAPKGSSGRQTLLKAASASQRKVETLPITELFSSNSPQKFTSVNYTVQSSGGENRRRIG